MVLEDQSLLTPQQVLDGVDVELDQLKDLDVGLRGS